MIKSALIISKQDITVWILKKWLENSRLLVCRRLFGSMQSIVLSHSSLLPVVVLSSAMLSSLDAAAGGAPPLTTTAVVSTYAGNGIKDSSRTVVTNGPALDAQFHDLTGVTFLPDGRVLVVEPNRDAIRVISADGSTVSTYAGALTALRRDQDSDPNNNVPNTPAAASDAWFFVPPKAVSAPDGRVFVTNLISTRPIYAIDASGSTVTTYAEGDPVGGTEHFRDAYGMELMADGTLLVAVRASNAIFAVSALGTITTYAGTGAVGDIDGPAGTARFNSPTDVALFPDGRVAVADRLNGKIRIINAEGTQVSTYVGNGALGYPVTGRPTESSLENLNGIVVMPDGRLLITVSRAIWAVSPDGSTIYNFAGTAAAGYADGPAPTAQFRNITDIDVDASGRILVVDRRDYRVRLIEESPLTIPAAQLTGVETTDTVVFHSTAVQSLFYDADDAVLSYGMTGDGAHLFNLSSTGRITLALTPRFPQPTVLTLTVTASDSSNTATSTVTVDVDVNAPPVFDLTESTLVLTEGYGQRTVFVINFDDGDDDVVQPLMYSISTTDVGFATVSFAAFGDGGSVTISEVLNASSGSAVVEVTLDDGEAINNRTTRSLTLIYTAVDFPPSVVALVSEIGSEDSTIGVTILDQHVTDADADSTFSVTAATIINGTGTVSLNGNTVILTPSDSLSGDQSSLFGGSPAQIDVEFTIEDNTGLTATNTIVFQVDGVNNTPTVTAIFTTGTADRASIDVVITDADILDPDVEDLFF